VPKVIRLHPVLQDFKIGLSQKVRDLSMLRDFQDLRYAPRPRWEEKNSTEGNGGTKQLLYPGLFPAYNRF